MRSSAAKQLIFTEEQMTIILNILMLVGGFFLLIKGADWLVEGSSSLAKRFNIPEIAIGLTIVAFGTSMPEFVVNLFGSLQGNNDLVLGNIIGSNNFNLLLILGFAGLVYPISVQKNTAIKEIPFSLFAGLVVFLLANDTIFSAQAQNILSRFDGLIMFVCFALFLLYIWHLVKKHEIDLGTEEIHTLSNKKTYLFISLGLAGMFGGGKLVVDSAVVLAELFGISQKIIAVTIVSGGTSLPELVTSAVAAFKKKSDIAIGNVVGSNIFNIFYVLGLSSLISPVAFNASSFNFDLYVLITTSAMLLLMMFIGKKYHFGRYKASIFLIGYALYIFRTLSN